VKALARLTVKALARISKSKRLKDSNNDVVECVAVNVTNIKIPADRKGAEIKTKKSDQTESILKNML